ELISLSQQAEARAVAGGDFAAAGGRVYIVGWTYFLRGQADAVLRFADRATAHWQAAKVGPRDLAIAIQLRGLGHQLKGDYPAAITAFQKVLELDRILSLESVDVAIDLNTLADAERLSDDFPAAERDYRESLRVALAVGYAQGVASST